MSARAGQALLGLSLPSADGRPLLEALKENGADPGSYTVTDGRLTSSAPATGLVFRLPTSPDGADRVAAPVAGTYSVEVRTKTLARAGKTYTYFDLARAVRR